MANSMGFATSIREVKDFLVEHQAKVSEFADLARQPNPLTNSDSIQLGAEIDHEQLVIQTIKYGSVADRAGLKPRDRIVAINGQRMRSAYRLTQFIENMQNEPTEAEFIIEREGEELEISVDFTRS
ncbi:MAG: PDZ domain-containing protein [Cyanobacteria bacterium P01_G01_bin.54]